MNEPFRRHQGIAVPLYRTNVDTDAIIPSREMKRVSREGLGEGLFANWRYSDPAKRQPNPDFVFNNEPWQEATILLAGANFGCGSSREHAVWALKDFGFRAIIAPSFGSIFQGNCIRNGIVPVALEDNIVAALARAEQDAPGRRITVDLEALRVIDPDGKQHPFSLGEDARKILLEGLDPIALTLTSEAAIEEFLERDRDKRPWVYL